MTSKPYEQWECYQRGMYRSSCDDAKALAIQCRDLLASDELEDTMRHVANQWSISAEQHLPQNAGTYRPWLGHSACCFEFGAPNWVTKKGWHLLTVDEQEKANAIADRIRNEWIDRHVGNAKDLFSAIGA